MRIDFESIIDLSYPVDEDSPREGPIGPARIYDTATMEADGYFEHFEIVRKEKRIIDKVHGSGRLRQAYIEYIARKR